MGGLKLEVHGEGRYVRVMNTDDTKVKVQPLSIIK